MIMGGAMVAGGIIASTTKMPGTKETKREEIDKRASFLFTGAVNSSTQGLPIPRGYGRVLIGSSVVSAAIYAEQLN
jgi:predicted phage tail protein